jgi:hypothetical protein
MKKRTAVWAISLVGGAVLTTFLVFGCERPVPHVLLRGLVGANSDLPRDQSIDIYVTNYPPAYFEFQRPRILEAHLYVDGKICATNPRIGSSNGKNGWGEGAVFPVPKNAKNIRIQAVVRTGWRDYDVVQEWNTQLHSGALYWMSEQGRVTRRE